MKKMIKNELSGWKKWEIIWLLIACSIITGLSIYWGDNLMGIISATTGVACVVCTGKGKLSAYLFGLVNCVLYAIISYKAGYYGEVSFNVISIPLQFVGFITWSKHMNAETHEVEKKHMSKEGRLLLALVIVILTIIYGSVLKVIGGNMPFVDSFTTVSSMIAMIISVMMYSEQWYMWLVINSMSIVLWIGNLMNGTDNWATLIMWLVFWVNSVINLIKWEKESRGK
jgi:nicotinamide mononucleotide transporter